MHARIATTCHITRLFLLTLLGPCGLRVCATRHGGMVACGHGGQVSARAIAEAEERGEQPSPGFGIHTVLAAGAYLSRSKASGNLSVADVEAIFDRKVGPAIRNNTLDPWMDYNTALYVGDLSDYTTPFKADNIPYMPITLNDTLGTYKAIYVHIPLSQVTFLIVAKSSGVDNDAHWTDGRAFQGEAMDWSGYGGSPPVTEPGIAYPLAVSRSISDTDEIIDFYQTVFGVQPTFTEKIVGGGMVISYTLPKSSVAIRYIKRPEGSIGDHSTKWFQDYLNTVEAHYQTSYKSCWPIWG